MAVYRLRFLFNTIENKVLFDTNLLVIVLGISSPGFFMRSIRRGFDFSSGNGDLEILNIRHYSVPNISCFPDYKFLSLSTTLIKWN